MKGLNAAMLALGNAATTGYNVYDAGRKHELEKRKQDMAEGKAFFETGGDIANSTDQPAGVNVAAATPAVLSSNYQPEVKKTGAVEDVSKHYNPSFEAGYKATEGKAKQEKFLKALEQEVNAFESNENKLGEYNKAIKDQEAVMTKFANDKESEEYLNAAAKREHYMNQANFHRELMNQSSQNVIGLAGGNQGLKEALSVVVQPGMSAGQRTSQLFDIATRRYNRPAPKTNTTTQKTPQVVPSPRQFMEQNKQTLNSQGGGVSPQYLLDRYNLGQ